jgi:hypothetical protein
MPIQSGRTSPAAVQALPRFYSPELLPLLQELLATIADIDCAHESDIEAVKASDAEEWLKQTVIRRLEEGHRLRRAPVVRRLAAVEERIRALAA